MNVDDNIDQENDKSQRLQSAGIAMDALAGLLNSYSTTEMKVTE